MQDPWDRVVENKAASAASGATVWTIPANRPPWWFSLAIGASLLAAFVAMRGKS